MFSADPIQTCAGLPISYRGTQNMTTLVEKILTGLAPDTGGAGELFDLHPVPSLLLARSGIITAANNAALRLFRCGTPVLVGGAMVAFFPELGRGLAEIRALNVHARVAVRRPDASNFIARVHLAPLAIDADATLLVTLEDLTELEDAIAANNKELESFMSVAGHDLRGPLRILKGFADALEDECGSVINEEGRGFLKEILKASERMDGLIDGLLTLSRAGRAEMNCESLDLSTLIDLVTYELRHEKGEREVEFKGEAGITVWGDVRLMMTVLRTLLGNAWKYTSHTATPAVRCYTEERAGQRWVCVADNGAGFDMAQAGRLFKPFTRLHRQDEFTGYGLGLATVYRIVKRHGGDIEALAEVGKGTTIRFWLKPAPH
jgi:signal transduction histidine kinase